jgi:hypothetical protein
MGSSRPLRWGGSADMGSGAATATWTLVRSGFLGYGAWIPVGFRSKRRGAHEDAHLGQQTTWGGDGCGVWWRCGSSGFGRCRRLAPALLRLQVSVGKLRHGVLILLLGFNCGERQWICLRTTMTQLLGFFNRGWKLELSRGLFIGLSAPSRRGYAV